MFNSSGVPSAVPELVNSASIVSSIRGGSRRPMLSVYVREHRKKAGRGEGKAS
jgi:hypothetical protein